MSHLMRRWGSVAAFVIVVGGCASSPETSDEPSATVSASAPASASASEPAEGPSVFAEGVISTDDEEYRISFAPDGQSAYFGRSAGFFPQTRQATIMETRLVDGDWTEPAVASFSGTYPDLDPWVAPDGDSITFSSIRPVGGVERPDVELFRVDRLGDGWGEPVHLEALGSDRDELGASVSADGAIWFASDRPGGAGGWDLYTAAAQDGSFGEPETIDDLNSPIWEFNPAINADGTILVFTSIDRDEGSGLGDLFMTSRSGDTWSAERPLAINSSADEYHASLSQDGATLHFVRRTGDGDLYEMPWQDADPG